MFESAIPGKVRACRVCGCTDRKACYDEERGACWWVEADLCSHCLLADTQARYRRGLIKITAALGLAAAAVWIIGYIIVWSVRHG